MILIGLENSFWIYITCIYGILQWYARNTVIYA